MTKKLLVALSVFLIAFSFMVVSCDNSSPTVPEEPDNPGTNQPQPEPEPPKPEVTYTVSISADKANATVGESVTYTASLSPALSSATYTWTVNGSAQGSTSSTFVYTPSAEGKYEVSVKANVSSNTASASLSVAAVPTAENTKGSVWYGIAYYSRLLQINNYIGEHVTDYDPNTGGYTSYYTNFDVSYTNDWWIPEVEYYSVEFDENGNGKVYRVWVFPEVVNFDTTQHYGSQYGDSFSDSISFRTEIESRDITFDASLVQNGKLVVDNVELAKAVGYAGAADINGVWEINDIIVPGSLATKYSQMLDDMMVQFSRTIREAGVKNAVTVENLTADAKVKINGDNLTAMVAADINASFIDNSFTLADLNPTAYLDTNIAVNGNTINIVDSVIPSIPDNSVTYSFTADGSVMKVYINVSDTETIMVPLTRTNSDLVVPTSGDRSFGGTVTTANMWDTYDSIASVLPSSITGKPIASEYGRSGRWVASAASDPKIQPYLSQMEFISFESDPIGSKDFSISQRGESSSLYLSWYSDGKTRASFDLKNISVGNTSGTTVTVSYQSGSYSISDNDGVYDKGDLGGGTLTFSLIHEFTNLKEHLQAMYGTVSSMPEMGMLKLELANGIMRFYMPYSSDYDAPVVQRPMNIAEYFVKDGELVATIDNGLFPTNAVPNGLKLQVSIPVSGKTLVLFNGTNGKQAGVVLN